VLHGTHDGDFLLHICKSLSRNSFGTGLDNFTGELFASIDVLNELNLGSCSCAEVSQNSELGGNHWGDRISFCLKDKLIIKQ